MMWVGEVKGFDVQRHKTVTKPSVVARIGKDHIESCVGTLD